jgi:solute carrier family 25 carnitine/acylcarnitine transporter 20/29
MQTAPPGYYRGTWDVVKKTIKVEGAKGFYSGVMSPLLGQMFFRAVSFMTFFSTVRTLNGGSEKLPTTASIVGAGAATGFLISFIETPIDLVKTKLQIQIFGGKHTGTTACSAKPLYTTMTGCVRHILKTSGPSALMQGWRATAIRNVPANAMFFPVNEIVKQHFADQDGVPLAEVSTAKKLISGACAGVCYWTLTYPLDAIKGRAMAEPFKNKKGWSAIVRNMAFKDFFVGIVPCTARAAVACSAMFVTVDFLRLRLSAL